MIILNPRFRVLRLFIAFMTLALLVFLPEDSYAMHISEGILPLNWAALWLAVAMPFVAYGLWRLNTISKRDISFKPLVGLMAAVVFIVSCMPVPVPTSRTSRSEAGAWAKRSSSASRHMAVE